VEMTGLSRRERRSSFFAAIAIGLLVMLVAAPVVQAAVQAVKVKGKVKTADTSGSPIESEVIPPMGLLQAEGSGGAVAVRNFAGGGGFLGAADCTETTADGRPNFVEVSGAIVTGIIMTGTDGTIGARSSAVGPIDLLKFRVTGNNPNEFVGLGNGLTATAPLTFTCTGTDAEFVVLGQTL
jgi:hypothetical protein